MKKLWQNWKRFGHFMGDLLARVVLTVFYFTILMPFGLINTLFGDPLNMKRGKRPTWLARETGDRDMAEARRQF